MRRKLKKGTYYIGDPCYLLNEDDYEKIVIDNFNNLENYENFFISKTKFGDGTYKDNQYGIYPVDSGLLSILPEEICSHDKKEEDFCRKVNFPKDFYVENQDGIFYFDKIRIKTK